MSTATTLGFETDAKHSKRFWEKVSFGDRCWEWNAFKDPAGYGRFGIGGGVSLLAHRVSWWLSNGPIPAGKCVLHECDNRCCVNPAHLKLGDQKQNAIDRESRGRGRNGKNRPVFGIAS